MEDMQKTIIIEDAEKFYKEEKEHFKYATHLIMETQGVEITLHGRAVELIKKINKNLKTVESNDNNATTTGTTQFILEQYDEKPFNVRYEVINATDKESFKANVKQKNRRSIFNNTERLFWFRFFSLNNKIPLIEANTKSIVHELEHLLQTNKMKSAGKLINNRKLYNFAVQEIDNNKLGSVDYLVGYLLYMTERAEMNAILQSYAEHLRTGGPFDFYNDDAYRMVKNLPFYIKFLQKIDLSEKKRITDKYRDKGITFTGIIKRLKFAKEYYEEKVGKILSYHFPEGLIDPMDNPPEIKPN